MFCVMLASSAVVWFGFSFGLLLLAVLEYAVGFGLGLRAADGDELCVWFTGGVLQGLVFSGVLVLLSGFLSTGSGVHEQRVLHSTLAVRCIQYGSSSLNFAKQSRSLCLAFFERMEIFLYTCPLYFNRFELRLLGTMAKSTVQKTMKNTVQNMCVKCGELRRGPSIKDQGFGGCELCTMTC